MRRKKQKEKRFSCIPKRIRNFLTKKISALCAEGGVEKSDVCIVVVDALEKVEEIVKENENPNWRYITKKIYARVITHTEILETFIVPD